VDPPSLIVFGPAEGLKAFRLPNLEEVVDDTLALSSSELALQEDAVALIFHRSYSGVPATPLIRVGVYKQVYEKSLRRKGHSFGAAFEFAGALPAPATILIVLADLLKSIENYCVSDRRFCASAEFTAFLDGTLAKSLALILKDLNPGPLAPPAPIVAGTPVRAAYSSKTGGSVFCPEAEDLLEWFGTDPGGTQCNQLIVYQSGTAEPGPLLIPLPERGGLLVNAYRRLQQEFIKARERESEARLAQVSLAGERDRLKGERDLLNLECVRLKDLMLKEPVSSDKPARPGLSDSDLERIRNLIQEFFEEDRPRVRPKIDLLQILSSPDMQYSSKLVLISVVLSAAISGLAFFIFDVSRP